MSEVATIPSEARWFAVHVLSGQETNVKRHMLSRIKTEELGEVVQEVIIPTERISEIKRGKKVETERKLYPGYIFVKMELYDAEKKLHEVPWYFVKETPGVLGFADGDRPTPMKPDEVEGMLSQIRDKEEKITPKIIFAVGDRVKVGDGPFQSQEGVVEEVDSERGRVRVAVSIFGRSTPVELEYWQVERN
ncbi:MAG TPA: transcription termination/antitermination protein NusG [Verrucomicrobia subdivision 6 bacterium]|jgi:transcription termination/antitermination protein NusG|uniref:Transcription termination/antitermination protein NusG n=3 Tax=Verrucomicrobia subdivision 6 TaxID=134627 RepID=A0A0R2XBU3_9BACT|nr:MAG: antitermination protein NusG [Verrucomicrobia subdivision 6 bacterium BACL9 MAG-120507-bin52]KRP33423.1 MAG: antitermination protein NusG [Verrucomicrobia subdivision 6 bacterium BACL9 MAG-120820-bin42]KRP33818.1 MAG: antitermination protein NusG [Verrucomicrobia subdivision 6 bacterium BACL9 MAG-120924-bin69]MDA0324418.1 transcription termination/antitermination protein NusG [Verrucomicrobiota bacterium]HBZ85238.1 transcription termination/antitermination protein NusG [Verrucomicrobia 